jgi:hypothetical protein
MPKGEVNHIASSPSSNTTCAISMTRIIDLLPIYQVLYRLAQDVYSTLMRRIHLRSVGFLT